jgi:hypothetical protein
MGGSQNNPIGGASWPAKDLDCCGSLRGTAADSSIARTITCYFSLSISPGVARSLKDYSDRLLTTKEAVQNTRG